jgi:hypothetical protein
MKQGKGSNSLESDTTAKNTLKIWPEIYDFLRRVAPNEPLPLKQ